MGLIYFVFGLICLFLKGVWWFLCWHNIGLITVAIAVILGAIPRILKARRERKFEKVKEKEAKFKKEQEDKKKTEQEKKQQPEQQTTQQTEQNTQQQTKQEKSKKKSGPKPLKITIRSKQRKG